MLQSKCLKHLDTYLSGQPQMSRFRHGASLGGNLHRIGEIAGTRNGHSCPYS